MNEPSADGEVLRTKGAPVVRVQPILQQNESSALVGVAEIDGAKDEDGQDPSETTDDYFEASPPVTPIVEADEQHRDGGR